MVFKPILTKVEIKKIMSDLKKALKKAGIKKHELILFGSYAKGKPHPWSDVDICVLSSQFGQRDFDDMVKVSKIGKGVNYLLELFPLNPKDYQQGLHPMAEEIRKTGRKF